MELFHLINRVDSKESFLEFLEALKNDWEKDEELSKGAQFAPFTGSGPLGWQNGTIGAFLDAMHSWVTEADILDDKPSWKAFAQILYMGKIYE